jgi:hypothetical protein
MSKSDAASVSAANGGFRRQGFTAGRRKFLAGLLGAGAGSLGAARGTRAPMATLLADSEVPQQLGLLRELAGDWEGEGFILIARPDFHDSADLYLQLNQTRETLSMVPVGSAIPDRGFGQDDIDLFGLSYSQQVTNRSTGALLHLEPGFWVTQPATIFPPQQPPSGGQLITRMASIPHGNAVLAQGSATTFSGPPTLSGDVRYTGSLFPAFNSTPSGSALPAAGSSEKATHAANPAGRPFFGQYDLQTPASATYPRTPFNTSPPEPPLPRQIHGAALQDIVNDPIVLLQAVIGEQVQSGCAFENVALNFATATVTFHTSPNDLPAGPTTDVNIAGGGGGITNTQFLQGEPATGTRNRSPNAQNTLIYGTFWIENVRPRVGPRFVQLQYVQSAVLSFPIFSLLHPKPGGPSPQVIDTGWPHISVGTLRRSSTAGPTSS